MIRKVLAGICAFSLMYSCSKDDVLPTDDSVRDGDPVAAVFAPTFIKQGPNTRAWDEQWTGGEEVGIYMLKKNGDTQEYDFDLSKALSKNRKYTVADATGAFDDATSAKTYYPSNNETKVKFVAYSPYDPTATADNTAVYTFTNQRDQAEKEAVDFIFHKDEEEDEDAEYSIDANKLVKLKFKHKFSKILITVLRSDGGSSIEDLTAELIDMPASATVNLTNLAKHEGDSITPSTITTTINPHIKDDIDSDHAHIEAIVPPHLGSAYPNRKFKFTVDGREYIHDLAEDGDPEDFESGKQYVYVFTLAAGYIANCYIVDPGTAENPTTSAPISIARAKQYGGMPADAEVELEILWDDNGVINNTTAPPTLTGSSFTVTTTGNHGNAVVALRDEVTDDIYWSWHIWVTNYDPDNGGATWTNTHTSFTFMDRNLGATDNTFSAASRGLNYQWGRKDPFPGGTGEAGHAVAGSFEGLGNSITVFDKTASEAGANAGITESIRKPKTFFSASGGSGGWLPYFKPYLWTNANNKKGIYDPCPPGWRVPPSLLGVWHIHQQNQYTPWYNMSWYTTKNQGADGGENNKWPFGTYIDSNGNFVFDGRLFHHWGASSMVADSDGLTFRLQDWNYPNKPDISYFHYNKAYGWSVRCVRE